jgi:hypothetical protein
MLARILGGSIPAVVNSVQRAQHSGHWNIQEVAGDQASHDCLGCQGGQVSILWQVSEYSWVQGDPNADSCAQLSLGRGLCTTINQTQTTQETHTTPPEESVGTEWCCNPSCPGRETFVSNGSPPFPPHILSHVLLPILCPTPNSCGKICFPKVASPLVPMNCVYWASEMEAGRQLSHCPGLGGAKLQTTFTWDIYTQLASKQNMAGSVIK